MCSIQSTLRVCATVWNKQELLSNSLHCASPTKRFLSDNQLRKNPCCPPRDSVVSKPQLKPVPVRPGLFDPAHLLVSADNFSGTNLTFQISPVLQLVGLLEPVHVLDNLDAKLIIVIHNWRFAAMDDCVGFSDGVIQASSLLEQGLHLS